MNIVIKNTKRIISMVCVISMLMSLVPLSVFAAGYTLTFDNGLEGDDHFTFEVPNVVNNSGYNMPNADSFGEHVPEGKTLKCWVRNSTIYEIGEEPHFSSDVTYTAVWGNTIDTITITGVKRPKEWAYNDLGSINIETPGLTINRDGIEWEEENMYTLWDGFDTEYNYYLYIPYTIADEYAVVQEPTVSSNAACISYETDVRHDNGGVWLLYDVSERTTDNVVTFVTGVPGLAVPDEGVDYGQYATEPVVARSGYAVEGWYTEDTFDNKWDFENNAVEGDIILYANWIPQATTTYTATFVTGIDGLNVDVQEDLESGDLITDPQTTSTGRYLEGWYTEDTFDNKWNFATDKITDHDVTLYAKWLAKIEKPTATSSTKTYNGEEQSLGLANYDSSKMDLLEGTTITGTNVDSYTATFVLKDGYIWSDETTNNVTIYWEIIRLTINRPSALQTNSFDYDGTTKTVDVVGFDSTYMTKVSGWSGSEAGNYTAVLGLVDTTNTKWDDSSTENLSYPWSIVAPTTYTITVNGGIADPAGPVTAGTSVQITGTAPSVGKEFDHWTVNSGDVTLANANSRITTFTMGTSNVEVTASYNDRQCTISYDNGLSGDVHFVATETRPYNEYFYLPDADIFEGHVPEGRVLLAWSCNGNSDYDVGGGTNADDDWVFVAVWGQPINAIDITGISVTPSTVASIDGITITTPQLAIDDLNGAYWLYQGSWFEGSFEEGETYQLYIPVIVTDNEYILTDNPTITTSVAYASIDEFNSWGTGAEMTLNFTATATTPTTYTTTVTGGTADPSEPVTEGTTVTITATVPSGQEFYKWEITSGDASLVDQYSSPTTFTMGTTNVEIEAKMPYLAPTGSITLPTFTAVDEGYTAISAEPIGINITNYCRVDPAKLSYENSNPSYFDVTLNTGAGMMEGDGAWTDSSLFGIAPKSGLSAGEYTTTITLKYDFNDDGTPDATIGNGNVSFTVNAVAPTTYSITVNGGTANPEGPVAQGTEVTITANSPEAGKEFDHWEINSGDITLADATQETTSFEMGNTYVEVEAIYADTEAGGGDSGEGASGEASGDVPGDGSESGEASGDVPGDGSESGEASGDIPGGEDASGENPSGDDTSGEDGSGDAPVTPVKPDKPTGGGTGSSTTTYDITTKVENGGWITPGSASVKKGTSKEFTINTYDGYELIDVLVDGKSVGKVTTYTFKDVRANHTLEAKFKGESTLPTGSSTDTWNNPFTDVKPDDWFYNYVKYAFENGLFKGTTNTTFEPNRHLTRGMLVTVLYRYVGATDTEKSTFDDVDPDMYYSAPIAWAAKHGYVLGIGENKYNPDANITRQDLATIMYRYIKAQGKGFTGLWSFFLDYPDKENISEYAFEAVCYMTKEGILNGKDGGMFDPIGLATRAETAAIMQRLGK